MNMMIKQRYTSKSTSINSSKLLAVYKWVKIGKGAKILDYGCGKYVDHIRKYVNECGAVYLPYDRYNQSQSVNEMSLLGVCAFNGVEGAICSNVLNVVFEQEIRAHIVSDIFAFLKIGGKAFFTVYEGDKSGILKENIKKDSCQLNQPTEFYMPLISSIFGAANVERHGKLITAVKTWG